MKFEIPIEPKPQERARGTRSGRHYTSSEMRTWREKCRDLIAEEYLLMKRLDGPLKADVVFYIRPPQYVENKKKNLVAIKTETLPVGKKPDIDNYEKALYDSMSGIVFHDDGQIACHTVRKVYSMNPRIEVDIEEMECQK